VVAAAELLELLELLGPHAASVRHDTAAATTAEPRANARLDGWCM
jgi:hypothetical protein